MFGRRKQQKTTGSDAALLREAISDLRHDQEVKAQRRRRRLPRWWPQWADRRVGYGLGAILLLTASGARTRSSMPG